MINDELPKALPIEEQNKLLIEIKNGSKEAREKLINHNLRLVMHIVKKFRNIGNYEELFSVGCIGLIKATDTYDLTKNFKFASYATRCIENEILMFIRKNKQQMIATNLGNSILDSDKGNELTFFDIINDDCNIAEDYEKLERYAFIRSLVQKLPYKERTMVEMFFGFNGRVYMQKEIAEIFGYSQSWTSRIITKAIRNIKKQLEIEGFIAVKDSNESVSLSKTRMDKH